MRLTENIYLVGSGDSGFSVSDPLDCTIYLIDGKSECVLIDAGAGVNPERILENIRKDGFAPEQIGKILLTHAHGDHAGGASFLAKACGAEVWAMEPADGFVTRADLQAISLETAIKAGVYPAGYTFASCKVHPLKPGEILQAGDCRIETIPAEGHSAGHCCYFMETKQGTVLFAGDAIQWGGKIALQAIWDCELKSYIETVRRLAKLRPDIFLPAHGAFALERGWKHTDRAAAWLEQLLLPPNSLPG